MANFLEKWSTRKADKPKPGTRTAVDAFRARVSEQKEYLEEFVRDPAAFNKWRSTWFQRVPGGFGVTIGRDAINAGEGLSYVIVDTVEKVAEFLDDLASHASDDLAFQRALEENRSRRASLLRAGKQKPVKAVGTKLATQETPTEKPKRRRNAKA